ncbi:MAG: class I SAM-dependent methyltransferase [Propylenella sp.]
MLRLVARLLDLMPRRSSPLTLPDRRQQASIAEEELLERIAERWRRYRAAEIDMTISPFDDMYSTDHPKPLETYAHAGRLALALISESMLLARRTEFARILDLPCGGGRVTRQLVAFFPDATIDVNDIERAKLDFVATQFRAQPIEVAVDFADPPTERYDLIFVGSLVTHLNETLYRRCLDWLIAALAPGGVLIVTMHGRQNVQKALTALSRRKKLQLVWRRFRLERRLEASGFVFWPSLQQQHEKYGPTYGTSFNTPAWAAGLIERRKDAVILGLKEGTWGSQDALIVQKL